MICLTQGAEQDALCKSILSDSEVRLLRLVRMFNAAGGRLKKCGVKAELVKRSVSEQGYFSEFNLCSPLW